MLNSLLTVSISKLDCRYDWPETHLTWVWKQK